MVFGLNEIIGEESILSKSLGGRNSGHNFFKICLLPKNVEPKNFDALKFLPLKHFNTPKMLTTKKI